MQDGFDKYFLAIVAPSPLFEEALDLKNYFKEKYNSKGSLNSPPHITLHMPFLWRTHEENVLISSLERFSKDKKPFEIKLEGFGAFPPRVIFIAVEQNQTLSLFQAELQKFCKTELNLFNAQYKDLPFHPHLTLAFRDLKKNQFTAAWEEFKSKSFSFPFTADSFTLLKHDGKYWQQLHHFTFK